MTNQLGLIRPTLIDFNPDKLHHFPFIVSLDRYNGSWNYFTDLSNKACVPNQTEYVKIKVLNMVTRFNESKTLIKVFHVI